MASLYKKPVMVKDPATGEKVKGKSKKWWGQYKNADGCLKRVPLAIDKSAARAMLDKIVKQVEREKAGLVDPTDEQRKRPLKEHIREYEAFLDNKGVTEKQKKETISKLNKIAAARRWKFIADINAELILAYRTIQQDVEALIAELAEIEERYLPLSRPRRNDFYYEQRDIYNADRTAINYDSFQEAWIKRTAQLIFLNKTCYNGLFRVNSQGEYNVPFGRYKNPTICDASNLRAVSALLQRVLIHYGHYSDCADMIDEATLVYFDPPYRPISATANFTAYSPLTFDDSQQLELAQFYRRLDRQGAILLLSNSDPKNIDPDDGFLEDAYEGFRIERVQARRRINRNAEKRGPINELLILNY